MGVRIGSLNVSWRSVGPKEQNIGRRGRHSFLRLSMNRSRCRTCKPHVEGVIIAGRRFSKRLFRGVPSWRDV